MQDFVNFTNSGINLHHSLQSNSKKVHSGFWQDCFECQTLLGHDKLHSLSFTDSTKPPWHMGVSPKSYDESVSLSDQEASLKEKWGKSGRWGAWERSRKIEAAKNKHEWIKRGRVKSEIKSATGN